MYSWCEESPRYNLVNVDLFDALEGDLMLYDAIGSVFITGDFNSRVGERIDYILFDYVNTYIDADDYVPDKTLSRASRDKVCNAFGVRLLDICKSNFCVLLMVDCVMIVSKVISRLFHITVRLSLTIC